MGAFEGKSKAIMYLICSLNSEQKYNKKISNNYNTYLMSGIKSNDFSNICQQYLKFFCFC